jgi:hypothetical protein
MASYPHAVRLPEIQPQSIEVNPNACPLPRTERKETKFVIKIITVIPQ